MPDEPASALEALLDGDTLPASALTTIGYRFLGLDPASGAATCAFTGTEAMRNLGGSVQGGFVAAMLDATLSTALLAKLAPGQVAPTLDLRISYLRPTPLGPLTCRGRVVHRGATVGFLAGELLGSDGEPLATASATVRIITSRESG